MKNFIIRAALLMLVCAQAFGQSFIPGQLLTASQLNQAFSSVLPLTGGVLSGPLTVRGVMSPYAGILQTGGATSMQNLQSVTGSGFYASGAGSVYSFYPTIGYNSGDHQRAQQYLNFNSAQGGAVSETGIAINATMNTGFVPPWAQSTVYATGALVDTAGNVYQATTGGTSAATGTGPTGTGSSISDGTVTWAFQCANQCNAKMPFFVSAVAGPGAGKVWAGDVALTLNPGWKGGFAPSFEIDMTNNSGTNCPTCQNLFISGDAGTNTIGAGISMFTPSTTNYQWVNGYQITGAKSVTNASFSDAASGQYSYQDTGTHTHGVYLNGTYSQEALWANNFITEQVDYARINLFPASNSNLNRWRVISNANGSSGGSLVLQYTTDGFNSSFINGMTLDTSGNATTGNGLSVPGPVSGAGFSNYLASPPAIGATSANAGAFTTLSASGAVSGSGFSAYLASPPAIGGTTPNSGAFTSISTTGKGAMPLYGTTGTAVNAPHMVQGTVALASGSATVTLSGSAAFSSASTYTCTANDTTAASAVKVSQGSGTSITFTGTGTDSVQFLCAGS
ncbi:hypothetical protein KDW37_29495 [Burkholderia cenocepacia]|uniref:hypothetical protein n=1 Tax=Burkholderia cenocepacia TaxID=95486 RepID=UPI001BA2A8D7|nr:hypothetical protein [Burkholderia cenocepacia]MBR8434901.1 hypothetical protein [Burkholderia cenocepacia]